MKVEKITLESIKKYNPCKTGIEFFKRNKLEGFPVELIPQIKGDYKGFVDWIKSNHNQLSEYRFDHKGNIIWKKDCFGIEYKWEYRYDERGNKIWMKDCYRDEYEWRYDESGNVMWTKDRYRIEWNYSYECDENWNIVCVENSYGIKRQYRYDQKGNLIYHKTPSGFDIEYGYDEIGNRIWMKDECGKEYFYEVEYYDDGQLKRYRDLYIPWFEK